jgi:anaerobic selenocysteine-containing dehydrogenase
VFGRAYEEIWTRMLERIGWRARPEGPDDVFWRAILKTGGWWDPIYYHKEWSRALKTEAGRFEFFPTVLWRRLQRSRSSDEITDDDKNRILPHYDEREAGGRRGDYPFALLVYSMENLAQVESPNQPWLQEISGRGERQAWTTWLDINPEDAEHHHLANRDEVLVESEKGRAKIHCRFDHGVQPGTVRVPFGLGHAAGGRWMKGIGVTPANVVTATYDPRTGTPIAQTTRVRIRKA